MQLQLVLVRALLDRARESARDGTEVGLMVAILLADLSVETIVKAALTDRRGEIDKSSGLRELLKELRRTAPGLAERDDIFGMAGRLRDARNPVQHAGAHSGRAIVEALLSDAEKVISAITTAVFNEEFNAVSVATLVRTSDLRQALQAAAAAITDGKFNDALVLTIGAYDSLRIRWGKWVRYALGDDMSMDKYGGFLVSHPVLAAFGPEHPHAVETSAEGSWREITLVALGFSVRDLIRIENAKRLVRVLVSEDSDAQSGTAGIPPTTREEALDVLEIVARQIWRLESSQPELLENPPPSPFDAKPELKSPSGGR